MAIMALSMTVQHRTPLAWQQLDEAQRQNPSALFKALMATKAPMAHQALMASQQHTVSLTSVSGHLAVGPTPAQRRPYANRRTFNVGNTPAQRQPDAGPIRVPGANVAEDNPHVVRPRRMPPFSNDTGSR